MRKYTWHVLPQHGLRHWPLMLRLWFDTWHKCRPMSHSRKEGTIPTMRVSNGTLATLTSCTEVSKASASLILPARDLCKHRRYALYHSHRAIAAHHACETTLHTLLTLGYRANMLRTVGSSSLSQTSTRLPHLLLCRKTLFTASCYTGMQRL